jgi:hypothetical protein
VVGAVSDDVLRSGKDGIGGGVEVDEGTAIL